jgi:hypothetical protein
MKKTPHIIHLAGGVEKLTRCGAEGIVHIVGPAKIHQVTCAQCRDWYYDMRLRLTANEFMR